MGATPSLRRGDATRGLAPSTDRGFRALHAMRVSHETIYMSLFVQAKAGLPREFTVHLRTRRVRWRAQRRSSWDPGASSTCRPLHARPPEVEDRPSLSAAIILRPP